MISLAILLFTLLGSQAQKVIPVKDPNSITISFGSCTNTYEPTSYLTKIFNTIVQSKSDLWMWIGDAIYLDGNATLLGTFPGPEYDITNGAYVQSLYNIVKTNPNYIKLRNSVPIVGTWDDHDYAYDGQVKDFPYKQRNMGYFLDFVDEPANSPRRNQQGVYDSYYVGADKMVKVVLLDVRYNRDPRSDLDKYLDTDTNTKFDDMLGEEQWAWLDNQLADKTPAYILLVSGTQYLPDDRPVAENWFQDSLNRLYGIIKARKRSGVVLLSGDVHFAEMLKDPCPGKVGYRGLYEFTASGMTHYEITAPLYTSLYPKTYSTSKDRYFGKNIGVLKFKKQPGSSNPPNLIFEARDVDGRVKLTREVPYSDLVFNQALADAGCRPQTDILDEVGSVVTKIGGFFGRLFP